MLKILSRIPNRDFFIITKSAPEKYSSSKIKIKKISDEIKPVSEYENAIVVFDDFLGSSNSRLVDQYFTRVWHNDLDIYYLSQSYFVFLKRSIRNKSKKIILFNQTLKDIEHIYRDVAAYDMSFDLMILNSYAENHGKKIKSNFVSIDLKRENKEDIVFVRRAKKFFWKQHLRRRLFENI